MSCSNCNLPCIRVGGKCVIAELRKLDNVSFQDAWERITGVSMEGVQHCDRPCPDTLNTHFKLIRRSVKQCGRRKVKQSTESVKPEPKAPQQKGSYAHRKGGSRP